MNLTIYKASAGAGKTFTLAATYIAHLLSDEEDYPHKHQLAVTFTNKATAEMKERILQYLYSIATGDDDNDGFFQTVRTNVPKHITNKVMRSKARHALYSIIHDYDHFHVTTIDSFFQSLLSSLAHELGLSASFKVEISDKELLSKAVDRILANLEEKSEELKWITYFVKERMNDDKSWNIAEELKQLAGQITKETYMLYSHLLDKKHNREAEGASDLTNDVLKEYKKMLDEKIAEQRQLIAEKGQWAHKFIEEGLTYANISYGKNRVMPFILKCADYKIKSQDLTPPSDSFRKYADGTTELLSKANQKKDSLREQAALVVPLLADLVRQYDESMTIINSCELSKANLNPLRLLSVIDKEVQALNKENDRMLLAYTPLLFHNLSQNTDASFVFERAGVQYNHIMIDEFQDTSKLQLDNMRNLLLENTSEGNSCMLVGDVKQGIYRFRGGDWNALAGFDQGYNKSLNAEIQIETLKTNFRSGEVVVKFNNMLFTTAPSIVMESIEKSWGEAPFEEKDSAAVTARGEAANTLDMERIYPTPPDPDNHEVTQLPHDEGGYVRIQLRNNETEAQAKERKKAEKEARDAAAAAGEEIPEEENNEYEREASVAEQMIKLNEAGVPFNDMAILIRGNNDAQPLMKYFEEHHGPDSECPIALMSEEAFLLESSPAVMTIVYALRYISNPTDGIAWEYLRQHCPAGKDTDEIKAVLDKWNKEHYAGLPFYEVSCRIAEMFSLHNQHGQSPYIYYFLDAVLNYIDDHSADVNGFLEHWDEVLHRKAIPSSVVEGVRILTIHKSKGLAFHSVFIPYCDWKIETHPELIWTRPSCAPFNAIPILPVRMTNAAANSIYRNIFKQEMFDKYVENLNLLYVAFTRTRQNLLVWADCSKKGIATILRDSLDTFDEVCEFGERSALKVSKKKRDSQARAKDEEEKVPEKSDAPLDFKATPVFINFAHYKPQLVFKQSNNAQQFLAPELPDDADTETEESKEIQEKYRQTGILLHDLMSTIESTADVDTKIAEAARNGQLPIGLSAESVRKLIVRRINHPTARQWFDGTWRLYRECSLIYRKEGKSYVRRPDRVMMRGNVADGTNETIVVDFKFGKYKSEHREQVEHYINLLRQQGNLNVRGYLWYLYSGSIEPVS